MNNIDDMLPICHDCPYWEVCEPPYICEATREKQNKVADETDLKKNLSTSALYLQSLGLTKNMNYCIRSEI